MACVKGEGGVELYSISHIAVSTFIEIDKDFIRSSE